GELICSRCCGTKRRVEINCPPDCPYLHGSHDSKWISETRRKEDARFLAHFLALETPQAEFLFFLHHVVLRSVSPGPGASRGIAGLDDSSLRDVVETVKKTIETQTKGIVYHHSVSSPHLQAHADWLLHLIASRNEIPGAPPVGDEDVLAILGAMLHALAHHVSHGSRGERYFDVVERLLGKSLAKAPAPELPNGLGEPPGDLIITP
ncbi:MAG TPA: hypothetical protein VEK15_25170, partial [Vicinamibacteria bacterium]|nr:hypothetical protein [Vicinamibacteria bacterium]